MAVKHSDGWMLETSAPWAAHNTWRAWVSDRERRIVGYAKSAVSEELAISAAVGEALAAIRRQEKADRLAVYGLTAQEVVA
jgi:hypothetical protein